MVGERRREVAPHAVAIAEQRAVGTAHHQPARRRLLVGHADAALERRPGVGVAGIEEVEGLAREVLEAEAIEPARVVAAEQLERRLLRRGDVRVRRLGVGRKEVGRLGAHLVSVDHHQRIPLEQRAHARARLRLRQRDEVAVEIEQVVVAAAAGPRLIVLGRHRRSTMARCRPRRGCRTRSGRDRRGSATDR